MPKKKGSSKSKGPVASGTDMFAAMAAAPMSLKLKRRKAASENSSTDDSASSKQPQVINDTPEPDSITPKPQTDEIDTNRVASSSSAAPRAPIPVKPVIPPSPRRKGKRKKAGGVQVPDEGRMETGRSRKEPPRRPQKDDSREAPRPSPTRMSPPRVGGADAAESDPMAPGSGIASPGRRRSPRLKHRDNSAPGVDPFPSSPMTAMVFGDDLMTSGALERENSDASMKSPRRTLALDDEVVVPGPRRSLQGPSSPPRPRPPMVPKLESSESSKQEEEGGMFSGSGGSVASKASAAVAAAVMASPPPRLHRVSPPSASKLDSSGLDMSQSSITLSDSTTPVPGSALRVSRWVLPSGPGLVPDAATAIQMAIRARESGLELEESDMQHLDAATRRLEQSKTVAGTLIARVIRTLFATSMIKDDKKTKRSQSQKRGRGSKAPLSLRPDWEALVRFFTEASSAEQFIGSSPNAIVTSERSDQARGAPLLPESGRLLESADISTSSTRDQHHHHHHRHHHYHPVGELDLSTTHWPGYGRLTVSSPSGRVFEAERRPRRGLLKPDPIADTSASSVEQSMQTPGRKVSARRRPATPDNDQVEDTQISAKPLRPSSSTSASASKKETSRRVRFCTFDFSTVPAAPADPGVFVSCGPDPDCDDVLQQDEEREKEQDSTASPTAEQLQQQREETIKILERLGIQYDEDDPIPIPGERVLAHVAAACDAAADLRLRLRCPAAVRADEALARALEGIPTSRGFDGLPSNAVHPVCACADLWATFGGGMVTPDVKTSKKVGSATKSSGKKRARPGSSGDDVDSRSRHSFDSGTSSSTAGLCISEMEPQCPLGKILALLAGVASSTSEPEWLALMVESDPTFQVPFPVLRSAARFYLAELTLARVAGPADVAPLPLAASASDLLNSALRFQLRRAFNAFLEEEEDEDDDDDDIGISIDPDDPESVTRALQREEFSSNPELVAALQNALASYHAQRSSGSSDAAEAAASEDEAGADNDDDDDDDSSEAAEEEEDDSDGGRKADGGLSVASATSSIGGVGKGGAGAEEGWIGFLPDTGFLSYNLSDLGALVHRALAKLRDHREVTERVLAPLRLREDWWPAEQYSTGRLEKVEEKTEEEYAAAEQARVALRQRVDSAPVVAVVHALEFCEAHAFMSQLLGHERVRAAMTSGGHCWRALAAHAATARRLGCVEESHFYPLQFGPEFADRLLAERPAVHTLEAVLRPTFSRHVRALGRLRQRSRQRRRSSGSTLGNSRATRSGSSPRRASGIGSGSSGTPTLGGPTPQQQQQQLQHSPPSPPLPVPLAVPLAPCAGPLFLAAARRLCILSETDMLGNFIPGNNVPENSVLETPNSPTSAPPSKRPRSSSKKTPALEPRFPASATPGTLAALRPPPPPTTAASASAAATTSSFDAASQIPTVSNERQFSSIPVPVTRSKAKPANSSQDLWAAEDLLDTKRRFRFPEIVFTQDGQEIDRAFERLGFGRPGMDVDDDEGGGGNPAFEELVLSDTDMFVSMDQPIHSSAPASTSTSGPFQAFDTTSYENTSLPTTTSSARAAALALVRRGPASAALDPDLYALDLEEYSHKPISQPTAATATTNTSASSSAPPAKAPESAAASPSPQEPRQSSSRRASASNSSSLRMDSEDIASFAAQFKPRRRR